MHNKWNRVKKPKEGTTIYDSQKGYMQTNIKQLQQTQPERPHTYKGSPG